MHFLCSLDSFNKLSLIVVSYSPDRYSQTKEKKSGAVSQKKKKSIRKQSRVTGFVHSSQVNIGYRINILCQHLKF